MQPVKGEEEKEGEGRVKKVRQTDEYNQHLRKEVRGDKREGGREGERDVHLTTSSVLPTKLHIHSCCAVCKFCLPFP